MLITMTNNIDCSIYDSIDCLIYNNKNTIIDILAIAHLETPLEPDEFIGPYREINMKKYYINLMYELITVENKAKIRRS